MTRPVAKAEAATVLTASASSDGLVSAIVATIFAVQRPEWLNFQRTGKDAILKNPVHLAFGLASVLMPAMAAADPPPTAVLTVRITQLRSNDGKVSCSLYASATGFPTDPSKAAQSPRCAIQAKTSTCSFEPIPAGTYGVACFHDENGNGKLDTGLFGVPTEGTVASNHAQGTMGPPPFDKAKFSFTGQATTLDLHMSY